MNVWLLLLLQMLPRQILLQNIYLQLENLLQKSKSSLGRLFLAITEKIYEQWTFLLFRHFAVTSNPSSTWVSQQIRNATPFGRTPKYLIHDNDPTLHQVCFNSF